MSTTIGHTRPAAGATSVKNADLKLEAVVIPVSDVDRAKAFYGRLDWRLDADFSFDNGFRVVQFTPPGSGGSVHSEAAGAQFRPGSVSGRLRGRAADGATYGSFATFSDPDGNTWLLQEVTKRLAGRVDAAATAFSSAADLAGALRRAAAAHGEHKKRTGQVDANWPDWYASYMVAEQAGTELPA